ncbi:hypothetical protein M3204_10685 [Mesobacillus subterraneus]|jgi:hypothetical protein|uniref:hypothetical protein n=1 Tax=Mesobacillus subterraneus TaxID=285983 RepID=UPI0020425CB0|nr:hypothetical protein [Mesobacillus subterraneus]MCM3664873.1 hypothetical protein [Mesobacillus subterraneus]MCM3681962.1 hypothetical protein [Mesobacillus subterraneus]
MAKNRESYLWLLWMSASTLLAYFYLSITVTIALFLSGLIMVSKCLIEDFLRTQDDEERRD